MERYHFDDQLEEGLATLFKEGVGLSVQTITGTPAREKMLREKYNPDIEGMEGAALFYVSLLEHLPFLQLRSVSNPVGLSDSSKWTTSLALKNLKEAIAALCKLFNL